MALLNCLEARAKLITTKTGLTSRAVDLAYALFLTLGCKFSILRWRSRFWVRQTTNANRWALDVIKRCRP